MPSPDSFTCPACGMTSHNPDDVAQGYCGNCHDFTGPRKALTETVSPEVHHVHDHDGVATGEGT